MKSKETLVIQSVMSEMPWVEDFLTNMCDRYHLEAIMGMLSVAVPEAVKNAIVHGNNSDPQKRVFINCDIVSGGVSFTIQDQGVGFDYRKFGGVPSDGVGSGIFFMNSLSDKIEYNEKGNIVKLTFLLPGIEPEKYDARINTLIQHFKISAVEA